MPREKEVITLSGQAAHLVVNQQGATLTVNLPGLTEGIKLGMGELVVVLSESDWDHVLASFRSLKEESAIPRLESERDHFQAQAREFELRAVEAEHLRGALVKACQAMDEAMQAIRGAAGAGLVEAHTQLAKARQEAGRVLQGKEASDA